MVGKFHSQDFSGFGFGFGFGFGIGFGWPAVGCRLSDLGFGRRFLSFLAFLSPPVSICLSGASCPYRLAHLVSIF